MCLRCGLAHRPSAAAVLLAFAVIASVESFAIAYLPAHCAGPVACVLLRLLMIDQTPRPKLLTSGLSVPARFLATQIARGPQ